MRSRRPIEDVIAELRAWQRTAGLSHEEIANGAEVDISSVYRLFADDQDRSRYGSALKAVCKFAKIAIAGHQRATDVPPVVREAVLRTWDGSAEHANRLASAITAVGELIRQAVSSK